MNAKTTQKHVSRIVTANYNVANMADLWTQNGMKIQRSSDQFKFFVQRDTADKARYDLAVFITQVSNFLAVEDFTMDITEVVKINENNVATLNVYIAQVENAPMIPGEAIREVCGLNDTTDETPEVDTDDAGAELDTYHTVALVNYNDKNKTELAYFSFHPDHAEKFQWFLDNANNTGGYQMTYTDTDGKITKRFMSKAMACELLNMDDLVSQNIEACVKYKLVVVK